MSQVKEATNAMLSQNLQINSQIRKIKELHAQIEQTSQLTIQSSTEIEKLVNDIKDASSIVQHYKDDLVDIDQRIVDLKMQIF